MAKNKHEEKQYHVEEDEEPEIQPIGVFGRQGGPGLRPHFVVSVAAPRLHRSLAAPGGRSDHLRRPRVHLHFAPVAAPESEHLKCLRSRTSAFSSRKWTESNPMHMRVSAPGKRRRPVPPSAGAVRCVRDCRQGAQLPSGSGSREGHCPCSAPDGSWFFSFARAIARWLDQKLLRFRS